MDTASLTSDALRHVLGLLEWRDLCSCALVCTSWHALAAENALWQKHISQEYYRPGLLTYSVTCLPSGWKQQTVGNSTTVAAAAAAAAACSVMSHKEVVPLSQVADSGFSTSVSTLQQWQPAAAGTQDVQDTHPPINTPGLAKSLLSSGLLHAAAPHQALLARFHAALSQITGWRLVLKAAAAAAGPSNIAQAAAPSSIAAAQPGPQAQHPTASGPAAAASSAAMRQEPVVGNPAPLSMQALQSGGGWAVGCVMMQQQEQSCWVRFNLPHELKTDPEVHQALQAKQVTAVVQGLGPKGWFDVATADEFKLSDHDMEILMQSHQTGFYAWDQAEEGGVDRYGQLQPMPWDLSPGHQQKHSEQPQQQEHQQNTRFESAAQAQQVGLNLQQQQQPAQGSAVEQVTQQLQQQELLLQQQEEDTTTATDQPPQLRMLVYVHYQQLLQVLPWAPPQTLPLPARPVLDPPVEFAKHLLSGPCALWLQLDVCQLHGGHRLGSCIAPLVLWTWDSAKGKFRCIEEELMVVLYKPDSCLNSTEGVGGAADASAAPAAADQRGARNLGQQAQQITGSSAQTPAGAAGQGSAGCRSNWLSSVSLDQDAFQQVLVGSQCLYGAGRSGRDGSVLHTAAAALQELMATDEIMVDFALFDAAGHLLMGRAGVEVWSKQVTDAGCIMPGAAQQAAGSDSTHTQPGPGAVQRANQAAGSSTGLRSGQRQAPQDALQDEVDLLWYYLQVPEVQLDLAETVRYRSADSLSVAEHIQAGLTRQETEVLEDTAMAEEWVAAQAQRDSSLPSVEFTRTQHKLHYLVDGISETFFWHTCIVVDAEPPPAGFVQYGDALGALSTVSMSLTWGSLRALFGLLPYTLRPN